MPEDITTTHPTEAGKQGLQKPRSMSAEGLGLQAERFRGLNQKAAAALGRTGSEPANHPSTSQAGIPSARPRLILLSPQMVTRRSPLQTRPPFDPVQNLEDGEFARSVEAHGVIQPILVYRIEGEATLEAEYGLISGHRRLDAALYDNLASIPALLMPPETSVENRDILALLENLQRKDLQPVEKAAQIQRLMDTYGYTHRVVAELVGLSESHLSSLLGLLSAPPEVQEAVSSGKLGVRNARKVIQMSEPKRRQVLDLTRDGLTLTDALEEARADPETEPEGKNPIKSKKGGYLLEAPDTAGTKDEIGAVARRSAEPAREAASPLMQMLGEQNDAFKQVLHDRSLVSLVPPKHYLLMAIIWRSSGSNTQQAVATYQSLTNAAKNELEKAISSIYKLSVLPRRPRDANGEDLVAAYLSMAIQILLRR